MNTSIPEEYLREKAVVWLKKKFHKYKEYLPFQTFHEKGITVTEFLRKTFYGEELTRIPKYSKLTIRPDVIGIIVHDTNVLNWIIGECKSDNVVSADFRQTKNYADTANAFAAFLFFCGRLTNEVKTKIKNNEHVYRGRNKFAREVLRRLDFIEYLPEGDRFKRFISLDSHTTVQKNCLQAYFCSKR